MVLVRMADPAHTLLKIVIFCNRFGTILGSLCEPPRQEQAQIAQVAQANFSDYDGEEMKKLAITAHPPFLGISAQNILKGVGEDFDCFLLIFLRPIKCTAWNLV
jgi:hypothetical protein